MTLPAIDVLLETSAVVTTVVQFLSGVIVCLKYFNKKSTGESSGVPFISGFLSCCLWLRYGLLTSEEGIILVNFIGACLFFLYTIIFYIFCVNKTTHLKQLLFALAVLAAVAVYTNGQDNPKQIVHVMGIACCVVSVCFFAAPLTNLVHVIRVKNAECLPFPLIAMSFVTSLLWLLYGILISDTFIQLPNFLGCVLSLLQLCLFVFYPPKTFSGPGYKLLDQSVIF